MAEKKRLTTELDPQWAWDLAKSISEACYQVFERDKHYEGLQMGHAQRIHRTITQHAGYMIQDAVKEIEATPNNRMRIETAVDMILNYGIHDGGHHKHWVLDQTLRILLGPSEYKARIEAHNEGSTQRSWDEGVAP